MYEPRTYRHRIKDTDLVSFQVTLKETDLFIRAEKNLKSKAKRLVLKYRSQLERYIERYPAFLSSLEPLPIEKTAPVIVKVMMKSSVLAGVGPMASVAGAIAEFVGSELLPFSSEIIVENGGDIYIKSRKKRVISIYAGESPLSGKIGLEIDGKDTPLGICTSSGTVGHSLSYGQADAVVVVSNSTPLADAIATATGNLVTKQEDIQKGIDFAKEITGLNGLLIIKGNQMGLWGDIKLC